MPPVSQMPPGWHGSLLPVMGCWVRRSHLRLLFTKRWLSAVCCHCINNHQSPLFLPLRILILSYLPPWYYYHIFRLLLLPCHATCPYYSSPYHYYSLPFSIIITPYYQYIHIIATIIPLFILRKPDQHNPPVQPAQFTPDLAACLYAPLPPHAGRRCWACPYYLFVCATFDTPYDAPALWCIIIIAAMPSACRHYFAYFRQIFSQLSPLFDHYRHTITIHYYYHLQSSSSSFNN